MEESERKARNASKLTEMHPVFRAKVEGVLAEMEAAGLRPRIQEAWRAERDQAAAFAAGTSKLKYGFHNVTSADGSREALAADLIDDNHVEEPPRPYILHLAAAALRQGLMTGAFFDLNKSQTAALYKALVDSTWNAAVSTGWDPCHVQVLGLTVEQAKAGMRPGDPEPAAPAVTAAATPPATALVPVGTPVPAAAPAPAGASGSAGTSGPSANPAAKRRFRLIDLETNRGEDFTMETAFKPAALLKVPWVSMLGAGADLHSRDSMAACAAMLLRAYLDLAITPDDFYVRFAMPEDASLSTARVRNALGSLGLLTDLRTGMSLADLFQLLGTGRPALVLLDYAALSEAGLTQGSAAGTHAALAVGMDSRSIYLHDPLYTGREKGEAHAYPLEIFTQAWKGAAGTAANQAVVPVGAIGGRLTRAGRVSAEALHVRSAPKAGSPEVGTLKKNERVEIRREVSGWGEIGENRWAALKYITTAGEA